VVYSKSLQGSVEIVPPSALDGLKSPEYLKLNPQGKMPLLLVDNFPIAESDTICRFLLERFSDKGPSMVPNTLPLRILSEQICRSHDQYIAPVQGAMYKAPGTVFSTFGTDRKGGLMELVRQFQNIESLLSNFRSSFPLEGRKGYLCGDEISLADATLFPTMVFARFMLPRFFDAQLPCPELNEWFDFISRNNEAAATVKREIEDALKQWEKNGRWEPIQNEMQKSGGSSWARSLMAALMVIVSTDLSIPTVGSLREPVQVVADSTGKMSTKLTARKRYLPRITEGVALFNDVAANPTGAAADEFLVGGKESKAASLARAMALYGQSLRKGEVPDAISREAEALTKKFTVAIDKLATSRSPANIAEARKALDSYLDFASLPKK